MAANADTACKRWTTEIEGAEKRAQKWVARGLKISARYRDERLDSAEAQGVRVRRRFNILWSNIQTLTPSLYARRPEPIAERRFLDHDPTGRIAATMLERCLRYEIEQNSFDEVMRADVLDYLLTAQGQAWVRYEPTFGEAVSPPQEGESFYDEGNTDSGDGLSGSSAGDRRTELPMADAGGTDAVYGESAAPEGQDQSLLNESVCVDYVHWRDFLTSDARFWDEVTWVARRIYMGRPQLVERFGDKGKRVPLERPRDQNGRFTSYNEQTPVTKAEVFEIWCKDTKEVHFIARGFGEMLETVPDPLKLESFWPCPRPLWGTMTHDSLIPVPDYAEYQDQAEQLDQLSNRIDSLTNALAVRGVYDASAEGLQRLLTDTPENKLIPVNSWATFMSKGGLDAAISWMPIKDIAAVLVNLQEAFEITLKRLYEITGIADIIRGQSDPRETLGAQQLKGNFAGQRIADRQREVARFCRDVIRIMAEIIAEQWSPETIVMKSSIMQDDGLTEDQPAAPPNPMMGHNGGPPMLPPGQGQPQPPMGMPPGQPGMPPGMGMPMVDPQTMKMQQIAQAIELLRNEKLRGFRIEIETDSTIQPDAMQEKQARTEFVQAMTGFIQQMIAGAEAMPAVLPLAAKTLQWAARGFRVGRDLESAIDRFISTANQQAQEPKPNPEAMKAQAEMQKQQMENQRAQQQVQVDMLNAQMEMASKKADAEAKAQQTQLDIQLKVLEFEAKQRQTARDEELAQADHVRKLTEMALGAGVAREQAAAKKAAARNGGTQ